MMMAYLTVGFLTVPWMLLGLYIYWIVRSGHEDSITVERDGVQ